MSFAWQLIAMCIGLIVVVCVASYVAGFVEGLLTPHWELWALISGLGAEYDLFGRHWVPVRDLTLGDSGWAFRTKRAADRRCAGLNFHIGTIRSPIILAYEVRAIPPRSNHEPA